MLHSRAGLLFGPLDHRVYSFYATVEQNQIMRGNINDLRSDGGDRKSDKA